MVRFSNHRGMLLFGVLLIAATRSLSAQASCGQADSSMVRTVEPYFIDTPEQQAFRQAVGYAPITNADIRGVVTDATTCQTVEAATREKLKGSPILRDINQRGWTFNILRFGPYLAMVFHVNAQTGYNTMSRSVLFIYSNNPALQYVGGGVI